MRIVINAVSAKSGGAATYMSNLEKDRHKYDGGHQYRFYTPPEVRRECQKLTAGSTIQVTEVDVCGRLVRRAEGAHGIAHRVLLREPLQLSKLSASLAVTLPFDLWMRSGLKPMLDEVLSDRKGLTQLGVSAGFGQAVWYTFNKSLRKERWSRPWALYVLKQWCQLNNVVL